MLIQLVSIMGNDMNRKTELCDGTTSPCGMLALEIAAIVINLFGTALNILHLVVLRKIAHMKGTAYLNILLFMSITDIFSSLTYILRKLCPIRHYYYHNSLILSAVSSTVFDAPSFGRFYILVVATVDRYTAICLPFHYSKSLITTRTKACNIAVLVFGVCVLAIRDVIFYDSICLDTIAGPSGVTLPGGAAIYSSVFAVVPISIILVLSGLIMRELYKMRSRSMSDQQKSINNAAKYILIVNLVFGVCLMPVCIWLIYSSVSQDAVNHTLAWITAETFALYGILNCFIYGWMSKTYQKTLAKMVCMRSRKVMGTQNKEPTKLHPLTANMVVSRNLYTHNHQNHI